MPASEVITWVGSPPGFNPATSCTLQKNMWRLPSHAADTATLLTRVPSTYHR